jgi:methionine synthase I (cobalamin-dependent)
LFPIKIVSQGVRSKSPLFEELRAAMKSRILILDGAMGTEIQTYNLKPEDFVGIFRFGFFFFVLI